MQVFRQHIGQLALAAQCDELHGGQPQLSPFTAAGFTQGVMERFDVLEDVELEGFGERIVLPDNAG